ncbi:MAG: YggW family oxidoreductase [Gammaproteobacteria bacterium]|nr:MAG: YggW family oxidoreductase [Gammaproteobacteria bacterium]
MHKVFQFTAPPPLALYIHLPWCVKKCPYCDFNSHGLKDELPEQQYVDALLTDLENELPLVWGRQIVSIFLGGGTPSLFSAEAIDRLLAGVRARLPLRGDAEITMEANPGTVEQKRFAAYRKSGINRLSIGIQSFNDEHLQALGRIHDSAQAKCAIDTAKQAGFERINLDLMYGLPNQSIEQALDDLNTVIDFAPEHISHYQLTLEPDTAFAKQPPELPDDDDRWLMQQQCQQRLAETGYKQYEVSAYARNKKHSRHNMNYWAYGDYLGIGAGAHGKITIGPEQRIERRSKLRNPLRYMAGAKTKQFIDDKHDIDANNAAFEFMLNSMRIVDGIKIETFEQHTGLDPSIIQDKITLAQAQGLLENDRDTWRTTEHGRRFLNNLTELFLPE